MLAAKHLPRPQSVQCRAKGIESLRRRLAEEGKLDTQTLELDRRDLAGTRLIFYTNNCSGQVKTDTQLSNQNQLFILLGLTYPRSECCRLLL